MKVHSVMGADGVRLHVEESGNDYGPPILFVHGLSQSGLTWRRQVRSELAEEFRLVTFDLRGHGRSDKPRDAYEDGRVWADDVHAIFEALGLDGTTVCCWSYGGLVVCDFLRRHGPGRIAAIDLVGAITKIGGPAPPTDIHSPFLALTPGLFSSDAEESAEALTAFSRLCVHGELAAEDLYLTVGCAAVVPPRVRQALLSRSVDNDDLLEDIACPVLVTHGERDEVIDLAVARRHVEAIPDAQLSLHPDVGHAPFLEAPGRFNRELRQLALSSAAAPARG
jgi:non-heme chloroperoxidase